MRLAVGADSVEGARTLAGAFPAAGAALDVMLKVDVGTHRVGVVPEAALAMARGIADLPGARLRGVFTHAGHAYGGESRDAVAAVGRSEGATLAAVAAELEAAGLGDAGGLGGLDADRAPPRCASRA